MKRLNGNKVRLAVVGIIASIVLGCGIAKADYVFGEPTALEATINSGGNPWFDFISNDGLELYIDKPIGGSTMSMNWDIYVSTRATINDPWPAPVRLGSPINTGDLESFACLSSDDLELYFSSDRPGGYGMWDLWVSTRPTRFDSWSQPENLGPTINTSDSDLSPWITPDGLELYFASARPGGYGNHDIWVARRSTIEDDWGTPENLGSVVNSAAFDSSPCLSPDGLVLFFSDYPETSHTLRPGGLGQTDMWMSRRKSVTDPWEPPVNLGSGLNSGARDCQPRLSPDGDCLYFSSMRSGGRSGGFNIWQVSIDPIIDLNNDFKVDLEDMHIMVDHWGQNNPLCDIGPTPLGDGVVDIQDFIVLTDHLYRLTAHWKFDETEGDIAYDSHSDHDGVINGNPSWLPTGGMKGGSLMLDGIDDYIDTPFILDPANEAFSVTAWVYCWMPGQVIISQSNTTGARGVIQGSTWLGINSSGKLMSGFGDVNFGALESESFITDVQWHHVGLVYDITTMKRHLYVDGAQVAVDADIVAGIQSTAGLYIGAGQTLDAGSFFSGLIDDVRIYNQALTAKEIAALAQ